MFSPFILRTNPASSPQTLFLLHTLPSLPSHPPIASRLQLSSSQPRHGSLQPSPFAVRSPRNATKRSLQDVASVAPGRDNRSGGVALQRLLPVRGAELPDSTQTCQKDSPCCERAVDEALEYFCSTTVHNPGLLTNDAKSGSLVFARDPQEMQTASRCLENPRNETELQIAGKSREAHTSAKSQELSGFPAAETEMTNDLAESASLGGENTEDRGSRDGKRAAVRRNREHGRNRTPKSANEKLREPEFDQAKEDEKFMREALVEAKKAELAGEVPVGAVMVSRGSVIARAHNRVEAEGDPTAHAEMLCIRRAAQQLGGWRLLEATMYVTLEPCPMCAGAILQARVGTVVWGAQSTLLGADGSWVSFKGLQNRNVSVPSQL